VLSNITEPRLGRTADWRRLIEDGFRLPVDDREADQSTGVEARGMLEVMYAVNAEPLGVLACGRHVDGGAWTHEQVQLLRRIASRVSVALLRAMGSTMSTRRQSGRSLALCDGPAI
jgi:GAF domain-containing protein